MNTEIKITPELTCHHQSVEQLGADAFGPGRFARTAFRLREGVLAEEQLSFVALKHDELVGSVQVTKILIGENPALVLGPLVVDRTHMKEGIGRKLMQQAVDASKSQGHELIILVGDEPYYRPFGFKIIPHGQIILPGPVDPARFLACELKPGALQRYSGMAKPFANRPGI